MVNLCFGVFEVYQKDSNFLLGWKCTVMGMGAMVSGGMLYLKKARTSIRNEVTLEGQ